MGSCCFLLVIKAHRISLINSWHFLLRLLQISHLCRRSQDLSRNLPIFVTSSKNTCIRRLPTCIVQITPFGIVAYTFYMFYRTTFLETAIYRKVFLCSNHFQQIHKHGPVTTPPILRSSREKSDDHFMFDKVHPGIGNRKCSKCINQKSSEENPMPVIQKKPGRYPHRCLVFLAIKQQTYKFASVLSRTPLTDWLRYSLSNLLQMVSSLQPWTKVLGQICAFGALAHTPDVNTTSPA